MRVAGKEEGKGSKAMALATRMVGECTVMATKMAMVMAIAIRVVGKQWRWQQRGQWQWQQGWQATKRANVMMAIVIATGMKMAVERQQQGGNKQRMVGKQLQQEQQQQQWQQCG
jgi:hypothetical protein